MIQVKISQNISKILNNSRLGIITSNVKVTASSTEFKNLITGFQGDIAEKLDHIPEKELSVIQETRRAYKKCGKEPSRYRPSSEALLRRLRTKRSLYQINNVVDAINLISIQSHYSIGGFDIDHIKGDIRLDIGDNNVYEAIGRGELNIEFMPGLRDDLGFFGTPTSDSVRTMVNNNTTNLLLVFYDFYKNDKLTETIDFAKDILTSHCYSTDIKTWNIEAL